MKESNNLLKLSKDRTTDSLFSNSLTLFFIISKTAALVDLPARKPN